MLYLAGNASVPLWDRDEPRYAQTSRQMLHSGDWIVPRLLDEPREKKPVFIYWCQATAMKAFGDDAFAARFPSVIFVTLTLIVIASVVWNAFGPRRALWTTLIFATSALTIAAAKMCITDGVLILFVVMAQICFYAIWRGRGSWPVFVVLGLSVGLGVLTKGPVVPAIIVLTWMGLLVLSGRSAISNFRSEVSNRRISLLAKWIVAAVIAAAVVTPWLIAIEHRLPGYTLRTIRSEVLERVRSTTGRTQRPAGVLPADDLGNLLPVEPAVARHDRARVAKPSHSGDPLCAGRRDRAVDCVRNRANEAPALPASGISDARVPHRRHAHPRIPPAK